MSFCFSKKAKEFLLRKKKGKVRFYRSITLSICIISNLIALTGCGNERSSTNQSSEVTITQITIQTTVTSATETAVAADFTQSADISEAESAALDYYEQTVFQVESMEAKFRMRDNVIFTVCATKDGELCPLRTIEMKKKDGKWEIINEGY